MTDEERMLGALVLLGHRKESAMTDRPIIQWTVPMLDRFKVRHQEAVAKGEEEFEFDGHTFATSFAGYLVTYLEEEFAKRGVAA